MNKKTSKKNEMKGPFPTKYEKQISGICSRNRFPFTFKAEVIDGITPDFINRKSKLILEVYNPERSEAETFGRVRTFVRHGYKVQFIPRDNLVRKDWKEYCTGMIRGFTK